MIITQKCVVVVFTHAAAVCIEKRTLVNGIFNNVRRNTVLRKIAKAEGAHGRIRIFGVDEIVAYFAVWQFVGAFRNFRHELVQCNINGGYNSIFF